MGKVEPRDFLSFLIDGRNGSGGVSAMCVQMITCIAQNYIKQKTGSGMGYTFAKSIRSVPYDSDLQKYLEDGTIFGVFQIHENPNALVPGDHLLTTTMTGSIYANAKAKKNLKEALGDDSFRHLTSLLYACEKRKDTYLSHLAWDIREKDRKQALQTV